MRRPALAFFLCLLAALLEPARQEAWSLARSKRIEAMKGVVLLFALRRQNGQLVTDSRGSGSVISQDGWILTNDHVIADDKTRRVYDAVAVSLTTRFDREPRQTCLAYPAHGLRDPARDLAMIKCESEINGQPLRRGLRWPAVQLGDSSSIVPGDDIYIVGYPGIGGTTVTFSAGKASGFLNQGGLTRAWIKTDAMIAAGNSGGAVFDEQGQLVGVPTAVRWEKGNHRDLGMVRPIEHAKALLARVRHNNDWSPRPLTVGPAVQEGRPTGATARVELGPISVQGGLDQGRVSYALERRLPAWRACHGEALARNPGLQGFAEFHITVAAAGRVTLAKARSTLRDPALDACLAQALGATTFPAARHPTEAGFLLICFGGSAPEQPKPTPPIKKPVPAPAPAPVGPAPEQPKPAPQIKKPAPARAPRSYMEGQIIDGETGRGLEGAVVLIMRPRVPLGALSRATLRGNTVTGSVAGTLGFFRTREAVPQGQRYGIMVFARGYQALLASDAIMVKRGGPRVHELGIIRLHSLSY